MGFSSTSAALRFLPVDGGSFAAGCFAAVFLVLAGVSVFVAAFLPDATFVAFFSTPGVVFAFFALDPLDALAAAFAFLAASFSFFALSFAFFSAAFVLFVSAWITTQHHSQP